MRKQGLDIAATATAIFPGGTATAGVTVSKTKERRETFESLSEKRTVISLGAKPEETTEKWIKSAVETPMPISRKLDPISDLLDADDYGWQFSESQRNDLDKKRYNLIKFYEVYCASGLTGC